MRTRKRPRDRSLNGPQEELAKAIEICICDINNHCRCYQVTQTDLPELLSELTKQVVKSRQELDGEKQVTNV